MCNNIYIYKIYTHIYSTCLCKKIIFSFILHSTQFVLSNLQLINYAYHFDEGIECTTQLLFLVNQKKGILVLTYTNLILLEIYFKCKTNNTFLFLLMRRKNRISMLYSCIRFRQTQLCYKSLGWIKAGSSIYFEGE